MGPFQIIILVLSILLLVADALMIWFEDGFWNWWGTSFSYVAELFMFIASVMLISAVLRNGSYLMYRNSAILLYIADTFCIASIIVFRMVLITCIYGVCVYEPFNWPALLGSLLITPLIVMIHIHMRSNPPGGITAPMAPAGAYQPMTSAY